MCVGSIDRALKRRLGEGASPEGLIASLKTRVLAEPALQGTGNKLTSDFSIDPSRLSSQERADGCCRLARMPGGGELEAG